MELEIKLTGAAPHEKPEEREAETVEVEIEEVSANEAPLVAIIHDRVFGEETHAWYEHRVRAYKERMFGELSFDREFPHGMYNHVGKRNGEASAKLVASWLEHQARKAPGFTVEDPGSRSEMLDRVRSSASEFLVVDGEWYMLIGEPRYVVYTFGLGHNHGSTTYFIETGYNPNIPHWRYFNANMLDELKESVLSVSERRGDTESTSRLREAFEEGLYPRIEVIVPEAFVLDPEPEHGEGNGFINLLEGLVESSGSAGEAGVLAFACALM